MKKNQPKKRLFAFALALACIAPAIIASQTKSTSLADLQSLTDKIEGYTLLGETNKSRSLLTQMKTFPETTLSQGLESSSDSLAYWSGWELGNRHTDSSFRTLTRATTHSDPVPRQAALVGLKFYSDASPFTSKERTAVRDRFLAAMRQSAPENLQWWYQIAGRVLDKEDAGAISTGLLRVPPTATGWAGLAKILKELNPAIAKSTKLRIQERASNEVAIAEKAL